MSRYTEPTEDASEAHLFYHKHLDNPKPYHETRDYNNRSLLLDHAVFVATHAIGVDTYFRFQFPDGSAIIETPYSGRHLYMIGISAQRLHWKHTQDVARDFGVPPAFVVLDMIAIKPQRERIFA